MRLTKRAVSRSAVLASAAAIGVLGSGGAALADPSNAPHVTIGTANCGSAGSFTFVVTESSGLGTPWNGAFVSTATGGRAIFHPASFHLTFTSPQGTETLHATKHSGDGPVSCTISATPFPGAVLSRTVTGTLTWRG